MSISISIFKKFYIHEVTLYLYFLTEQILNS